MWWEARTAGERSVAKGPREGPADAGGGARGARQAARVPRTEGRGPGRAAAAQKCNSSKGKGLEGGVRGGPQGPPACSFRGPLSRPFPLEMLHFLGSRWPRVACRVPRAAGWLLAFSVCVCLFVF